MGAGSRDVEKVGIITTRKQTAIISVLNANSHGFVALRFGVLCGAGLPMSPRKPLVWSEGLQRGARIFVEDGESPYAKQYGEIVEVRRAFAMPLA